MTRARRTRALDALTAYWQSASPSVERRELVHAMIFEDVTHREAIGRKSLDLTLLPAGLRPVLEGDLECSLLGYDREGLDLPRSSIAKVYASPDRTTRITLTVGAPGGASYLMTSIFEDGFEILTWGHDRVSYPHSDLLASHHGTGDLFEDYTAHVERVRGREEWGAAPVLCLETEDSLAMRRHFYGVAAPEETVRELLGAVREGPGLFMRGTHWLLGKASGERDE